MGRQDLCRLQMVYQFISIRISSWQYIFFLVVVMAGELAAGILTAVYKNEVGCRKCLESWIDL